MQKPLQISFVTLLLTIGCNHRHQADAFSLDRRASPSAAALGSQQQQPVGNILILDHLNINHEKGRHDWLKAFYFDFMNLVVDPRKQANLLEGSGTVWANIGAQQFHLPQGKPAAQVLEGVVTLAYPNLDVFDEKRVQRARENLAGSLFDIVLVEPDEGGASAAADASSSGGFYYKVTDPWGTCFHLVQGPADERDARGSQPGEGLSEGLALRDLTLDTPAGCDMAGIARFYERILDAPVLEQSSNLVVISVGPLQTLTFRVDDTKASVQHEDLRDENDDDDTVPSFPSNYGPHVSMYVADLPGCYQKAQELGIAYVNPRFKRRAYTLEQAVDDCMFRVLNIVDPNAPEDGTILRLEHEIRSVVKRDGSMYKSCPFDEIPDSCRTS